MSQKQWYDRLVKGWISRCLEHMRSSLRTRITAMAAVAFGSKSLLPLPRPLSRAPAGLRRFFPICCNQASIRQAFTVCMLVDGA